MAREKLIRDNLGLVHCVVNRYCMRQEEREDLVQIGIIGLILSFIVKKDLSTPVKVLSGLLLIGAGVILFTGLNSSLAAIVKPSLGDNATQENIEQSVQLMLALDNYSLGLGAIIGGICSCVSGAFAVLAGFFK